MSENNVFYTLGIPYDFGVLLDCSYWEYFTHDFDNHDLSFRVKVNIV